MARDTTTNGWCEITSAVGGTYPFTVALWGMRTSSVNGVLWSLTTDGSGVNSFALRVNSGDSLVRFRTEAGSNDAATTTTISSNVWFHALARGISATDRRVYLNAGGEGTNTTSSTPAGMNRTVIGASRAAGGSYALNWPGRIAEVAIWTVDLDDADERTALAAGVSPLRIRPSALIGYWPLWGTHSPEIDLHPRSADANAYDLSVVNTTAANHAPVVPFSRRLWTAGTPYLEFPAPGGSAILTNGLYVSSGGRAA